MGRLCRVVAALLLLIVSLGFSPGNCRSDAQQGRANHREEDAPSVARLIQAASIREAPRQQGRYRSKESTTTFPQWPPWPWATPAPPTTSSPSLEDAGSPSSAPAPSPAVAKPLAAPRHAARGITLPPEPATVVTHGAAAVGEASQAAGHARRMYVIAGAGASVLAVMSVALLVLCYRSSKVVTVRPWATGLSGQLQRAFVTGVPSLKRSELEAACEDFSNVIGSLSEYMMYKGTLSSGVEIAVVSTTKSSAKEWSKHCETRFRKKITSLSRVNHKNFVNLLGYCQEEQPFTRMMVFEYAPNGTLYEHLHVREDGHLDWPTRLRVAVGIAYCMEHMHQLSPPEILGTLDTSTVYLTDDFAAKIADVFFCSDEASSTTKEMGSLQSPPMSDKESVVYSYGMVLLEIMSGRFTASDGGLLEGWAASFLRGERQLRDVMDPGLSRNAPLQAETVSRLDSVIRSCTDREARRRPTMTEVARRLREITAMPPDAATPKVSPLWWAELEIISTEAA
ncbi:probable inactive receptor-like protein kinase At3g56050 [Lolium rigidum]|uniref:probable inactive receptor-like protein kinase At3g56050 n=1 Tax=Lolium rigidum TaxID=89674 RepID=UPI001F5CF929|nr:probable inactive receptor-like protein kinase At3g56050 [Lolium rigidum]